MSKKRIWFKVRRIEKNYTQKDLANMVNVSNRMISAIETGREKPSSDLAIKLSEILDVEEQAFYTEK